MRANSLYRNDIPGDAGNILTFRPRASNLARAWLATADLTATGYRVGRFMAEHARFATPADVRRKVRPGEVFVFWPQSKIAAELRCSERQVQRGVASLRAAGFEVRRRARPFEATYVFPPPAVASGVASGVGSGVGSHPEPRLNPSTEPAVEPAARAGDANPPPPVGVEGQKRQRLYGERAGKLVERWRCDWYPRFRDGVNVRNPDRETEDLEAALWLCEQFEDDELEELCTFFLRIPDGAEPQFQRRKTRTLRWCLGCAGALSRKLKLKGKGANEMTDKQKVSNVTREILADLEKRDDKIGQMVREVKADAAAQNGGKGEKRHETA